MTILYKLEGTTFVNLSTFVNDGIPPKTFYVNVTSKCPCSCTFCERNTKVLSEENSLWLKEDHEASVIINELKKYDISSVEEIVFCGWGEPTERIDVVLEVAAYIKEINPSITTRINTNGLGNLVNGKDITPLLKDKIDVVSISLNQATPEKYNAIARPKFGIESFASLLDFAKNAKHYVPKVVLTIVDVLDKEDTETCRQIASDLGVEFRIRPLE